MFENRERFVVQAVTQHAVYGLFVDADFVSHRDLLRIRIKMALVSELDAVFWCLFASSFALRGRRKGIFFPLSCASMSASMPDGMPACVSCETVKAMSIVLRGTPSYDTEIWPVLREPK